MKTTSGMDYDKASDNDVLIAKSLPPHVLKYVTRIATEMHNSDRKQDGIH